ncbi:MAG: hypothetical protein IKL96_08950 [Kiritimatiellae bacterium]|nr:hypothetical protein [Kiritimatiellia bacterium]
MKGIWKATFAVLATAGLATLAGCGLFWDDPYVAVTTAPLNWCEVHYYNARYEPVRRDTVRISGTGFVEVRSGTSKRVSDSFAKSMDDPTWDDYSSQQYYVDPNHVRNVFQELVNAGLFDKDKILKSTKYPSPGRFVAVRAAIEGKTFSEPHNVFESDPDLAERLYNLVREFKPATLGRKRAINAPSREKAEAAKDDKKEGAK